MIHLIHTPERGHNRLYIDVDTLRKEILAYKKHPGKPRRMLGVVEEGNNLFEDLPEGWKMYCRVAWREWSKRMKK